MRRVSFAGVSRCGDEYRGGEEQRAGRSAVVVFAGSARTDARRWGWGDRGAGAREKVARHVMDRLLRSPFRVEGAAADVLVFHDGADGEVPTSGKVAGSYRQRGADFAQRLEDAVARVWELGYARVVVVGTDVPHLAGRHVRAALRLLSHHAMVLGPDAGGGCYLIGLRRESGHLLSGVRWGENTDFAELRGRAGAGCAVLRQVLRDLDGPETIRQACHRGLPGYLRLTLARVLVSLARATGGGLRATWETGDWLPPASAQAAEYRNATGPPRAAARRQSA